jgi:hypothetical protein
VKSSMDHEPFADAVEEPQTRRDLLRTGGVAAIAGLLSVFGISAATEAKNGSALRVGEKNSGTRPTILDSKKGPALSVKVGGGGSAVGVRGVSTSGTGIGVQGVATADKGEAVGVQGESTAPDGAAGQFEASGGATAVEAIVSGKRGVALRTKGKLRFDDRSGSSEVSGGAEFVIPVAGGLSESSLVLATLQDHFPGVHVESASVLDAEDGLIVVRLNQAVPQPATVAWIVLD